MYQEEVRNLKAQMEELYTHLSEMQEVTGEFIKSGGENKESYEETYKDIHKHYHDIRKELNLSYDLIYGDSLGEGYKHPTDTLIEIGRTKVRLVGVIEDLTNSEYFFNVLDTRYDNIVTQ